MKSKKKTKKVKPRIKIAPPSKKHKSKKDYDRKLFKKEKIDFNESITEIKINEVVNTQLSNNEICLDQNKKEELKWMEKTIESNDFKTKTWVDNFLSIFGFKRKS